MDDIGFDDIVARAQSLADHKRSTGEIPEGTSSALDRLFMEVAPPGARSNEEGLLAIVDVLSRYTFESEIPIDTHRRKLGWLVRWIKRIIRPFASLSTRHLAQQLNAYHGAQVELLRALAVEIQKNKSQQS